MMLRWLMVLVCGLVVAGTAQAQVKTAQGKPVKNTCLGSLFGTPQVQNERINVQVFGGNPQPQQVIVPQYVPVPQQVVTPQSVVLPRSGCACGPNCPCIQGVEQMALLQRILCNQEQMMALQQRALGGMVLPQTTPIMNPQGTCPDGNCPRPSENLQIGFQTYTKMKQANWKPVPKR